MDVPAFDPLIPFALNYQWKYDTREYLGTYCSKLSHGLDGPYAAAAEFNPAEYAVMAMVNGPGVHLSEPEVAPQSGASRAVLSSGSTPRRRRSEAGFGTDGRDNAHVSGLEIMPYVEPIPAPDPALPMYGPAPASQNRKQAPVAVQWVSTFGCRISRDASCL